MTVELLLVRHGESTWNAQHRICGWTDAPLTARGRAQAEALRPLLRAQRFAKVWASDLSRAAETARLAYGEPDGLDARLREVGFGELEGAVWTELSEAQKAGLKTFTALDLPGGETFAALDARLSAFVDELGAGRHLIVTHGGVLRWFLHRVGVERFVANCAQVGIDWSAGALLGIVEPEAR